MLVLEYPLIGGDQDRAQFDGDGNEQSICRISMKFARKQECFHGGNARKRHAFDTDRFNKTVEESSGIWLEDQATLRVQQRGFPDRHYGKEEPGVPPQSLESSGPLVPCDQPNPGVRIKDVRHFPRRHSKPVLQLEQRYRPESSAGLLHSQKVLRALYAPAQSVPVSREACRVW